MQVSIQFNSYIASPYWPAKELVIRIQKDSGVNRQKSDEKRTAALKAQCNKMGMTYEAYLAAIKDSERQWYVNDAGYIYIPRHQLAGAFVEAVGQSPKALRGPFTKDNFRALVQVGDFTTEKTKADGVFERYVKLDASNMRSLQRNEYIGNYLTEGKEFVAKGVILPSDKRQADTVKRLLQQVVESIGVGGSRKMGFGRGVVLSCE